MIKHNQRDKDAINADYLNKNNKDFKNNFKFEKNKLNNKFKRHNDGVTMRDNDKFNNFYNNSKSFKKSKNEIDDRKFNYFTCEKSKH